MENKNYINVSLTVLEEDFEIAYAILTDYNFIGMEEKLDEIILSFEEKDWNEDLKIKLEQQLNCSLPHAHINSIEIIPDKNWNEEWEKNVEPVQISKDIVITPEWKMKDFDCKHKIIINPKMSFGTGQHSTTKLMAIMIEKFMIEENNQNKEIWIDAGTGTGVLAVVEAKLGAKKVYAFDNDDWSYQNAKENVLLNKVDDIVEVSQAEIAEFDFCEVDCISANMFFSLIISSLPKFYKSLQQNKGTLFISGILVYDREELITITEKNNFILIEEMQELEWCCFRFIAK